MTDTVAWRSQTDWRVSTLEPRFAPATSFWFRIDDGRQSVFMADIGDTPAARRLSLLIGQTDRLYPGAAIAWLNEQLLALGRGGTPVDALLATFLPDGMVHVVWAGLPAVYHRRRDGTVRVLRRDALPLGIVPEPAAPESLVLLDRGETLLAPNRSLEQSFAAFRTTPGQLFGRYELREADSLRTARDRGATALIAERLDARPAPAGALLGMNPLEAAGV